MLIKRIKISNYKTYLSLDLDLGVSPERPIVLIGGMNGGGKTTLFEAICGALYGLKIKNKAQFSELCLEFLIAIFSHLLTERLISKKFT